MEIFIYLLDFLLKSHSYRSTEQLKIDFVREKQSEMGVKFEVYIRGNKIGVSIWNHARF